MRRSTCAEAHVAFSAGREGSLAQYQPLSHTASLTHCKPLFTAFFSVLKRGSCVTMPAENIQIQWNPRLALLTLFQELKNLKHILGSFYYFNRENSTGRYNLNFADKFDRHVPTSTHHPLQHVV